MTSTKQMYFSTHSVRQTCCCLPVSICTIRKLPFHSCELILLAAMSVDLALPQRFLGNCHSKCYWWGCQKCCQKPSSVSQRLSLQHIHCEQHHSPTPYIWYLFLSRDLAFPHLSWQLTFSLNTVQLRIILWGKKRKNIILPWYLLSKPFQDSRVIRTGRHKSSQSHILGNVNKYTKCIHPKGKLCS